MTSNRTNVAVHLSTLAIAVFAASTASAQSQSNENVSSVTCTGTLTRSSSPLGYADVIVNGGSCVLDGVTVHGSIKVSSGGTLTTRNGTHVHGAVTANSVKLRNSGASVPMHRAAT